MEIKFFSIVSDLDNRYSAIKDNFIKSLDRIGLIKEHELVKIDTLSGDFHEGDFSKTVYKKLDLTYRYLSEGYHVLYSDLDIVFFKNPLKYLRNLMDQNNYDILFQHDYIKATEEDNDPGEIYSQYCTGFFFVKPSKWTIKLFDQKYGLFINRKNKVDLKNACDIYDQGYINTKLMQNRFKRLQISLLDKNFFPNGWYWRHYNKDLDPYIVHYNCIHGIENKEKEMKAFNHWLL